MLIVHSPAWSMAEDACARLPPPKIIVERLEDPLITNLEYSFKTLNSLGSAIERPANRHILGLTRGEAVVEVNSRVPMHLDASGQWECASPQITLRYGFRPMTLYVAREFPRGSCAYREIYEHELRHVRAYRKHAEAIESEIRDTLGKRFNTGTFWRNPMGQTQFRLQEEIQQRWIPYVKWMLQQVESTQARIDSPEEYQRVSNSCGGEIQRSLR